MARDGFLSRWSQKKLSEQSSEPAEPLRDAEPVADGSGVIPDQAPASVLAADIEPDEAELTDEELAALPKIEDFTAQTDLTQFMRRGVPKALKLAAMRKMWTVNPVISTYLDEARDYAYDWNVPGGVPGNGGTIDLADAARRVERLLSGRKPAEKDTEDASSPVEDMEPESAPVALLPETENAVRASQSATLPSADSGKTLVAEPHGEQNNAEASGGAEAPRRRHGSAMPHIE